MARRVCGFTLIELLVVIAVIAVLVGILAPSLGKARQAAKATEATVAVRSLMQAYAMYADANKGYVLPGHLDASQPRGVVDEFGNEISPPVSQRWTYRLAPFFDHGWAGTTHIGARRETIRDGERIRSQPNGQFLWSYEISIFPSFGLNWRYVGGDYRRPDWLAQRHHVAKIDDALTPSNLLVFGSARFNVAATRVDGYIEVSPPPLGATFDENAQTSAPATAFGNNHPRYLGASVIGWLDGHAGTIKPTDLLDRRKWSNTAARLGNPDWNP